MFQGRKKNFYTRKNTLPFVFNPPQTLPVIQSQCRLASVSNQSTATMMSHDKVDVDALTGSYVYEMSLLTRGSPLTSRHSVRTRMYKHVDIFRSLQLHMNMRIRIQMSSRYVTVIMVVLPVSVCSNKYTKCATSSSSRMRVMNHNWSATKQRLHPQSVAEISRHSTLSEDRIRQCETLKGKGACATS